MVNLQKLPQAACFLMQLLFPLSDSLCVCLCVRDDLLVFKYEL